MTLSIRALFGWVGFAAFAVAALSQANVLWVRLAFSAAVLFTACACLAAVASRGERRMFWIGAAVCSLGYFVLCSGWLTNSNTSRFLITQHLLEWITPNRGGYETDPWGRPPSIWSDRLFEDDPPPSPRRTHGGIIAVPHAAEVVPVMFQPEKPSTPPPADDPFEGPSQAERSSSDPPTVYSPPVQPYVSRGRADRFYVIGHSLFVILFGLLGGTITRRLAARA